MSHVTQLGRVMVPVSDQDAAIAFYKDNLGFELSADVPFGEGDRWVEVTPSAGGASIALVKAGEHYPAPDGRPGSRSTRRMRRPPGTSSTAAASSSTAS